jgi:hypothetical protein
MLVGEQEEEEQMRGTVHTAMVSSFYEEKPITNFLLKDYIFDAKYHLESFPASLSRIRCCALSRVFVIILEQLFKQAHVNQEEGYRKSTARTRRKE